MSFADYLRERGVTITSGKRDPNSRLGRANPKSWHNQGKAWDIRPPADMEYEDFLNSVKRDGWNVLEARNEVVNPSRNATGPHWHMAVDGRKEMNGLADIMKSIYPMAQQEQAPIVTPGQQQMGLASLMPQPQMQDTSNLKPKTFGKGGKGWEILGIIGDALQTAGGGQGTYAPYIMSQRDLETQGRQKLEQLMQVAKQKQADRAASLEDWQLKQQLQMSNAARMAQEAGYQPGTPQYQQFITQVAQRPIMIGGEAYAPQMGGQVSGLPQGYDPDEWEVIE